MKAATPHPAPVTLLAGGQWQPANTPDPLLCHCLAQAIRQPPSIAYIGAASGDDPGFFKRLSAAFKKAGAGQIQLAPIASASASAASFEHILLSADLIFLSGGDVKAGMHWLEKHGVVPLLRRLYKAGTPFFGLSAGSIMLAEHWVHWDDPDNDATAAPFHCLGLAPVICDTHAEDDDWLELKILLQWLPEDTVGYGIPSGGGLRVTPSGVMALGQPVPRFQRTKNLIRELAPLHPKGFCQRQ